MNPTQSIVKNSMTLKNPFAEDQQPYIDANLSSDVDTYRRLEECMKDIEGQEYACQMIKDHLFGHERRSNAKGVAGLMAFLGAPAVGKTMMAEAIAKALSYPVMRLDMTGYSDSESALFDFAGIHKSYKEAGPGTVTNFVYHHPMCVLILDELEKAGQKVLLLLLQILERGEIEDKYLQTMVSFKDVIIVMTLNSGRDIYDAEVGRYILSDVPAPQMIRSLRKEVRQNKKEARVFSDALLSRMSGGCMIMFNKLRPEIIHKIVCNTLRREMNEYHKIYGFDVDMDVDAVADILIMSEGDTADIRTLNKAAKALFKSHVARVCASIGAESTAGFFKTLKYTVDLVHTTPEVQELLKMDVSARILVYCRQEDRALFESRAGQGVEFLFADPDEGITLTSTMDLTAAILYVGDEASACGRDLFQKLHDLNLSSLYVYDTRPVSYTAFYRYTDMGVSECYSPAIKRMTLEAWLDRIMKGIRLSHKAKKLFRSGKVIAFDLAYEITEDHTCAEIRLTDLRMTFAMDAADEKNFVARHSIPDVTFDMVIGADDAKEELKSCVHYLTNATAYIRQGRRIPRGILLSGEPGTGKTMLAKALAAEAGLPFIEKNATEFLKRYLGEGAESIRELFRSARRYAPAIIFIDEIDAIAKSRMSDDTNRQLTADLVNTLLSMMDGFNTQNEAPVFVIAATNFSFKKGETLLDAALLRRFDTRIEVSLPDVSHRELMISRTLQSLAKHQVTEAMVKSMAKRSIGWNLSDLKLVLEKAMRRYETLHGDLGLSDEVLNETFESFHDGKKIAYGEEELRQVAYHEAGHALLSKTVNGRSPTFTTIVPRSGYGGYMLDADEDHHNYTRDELLNRMCVCFGGRVAEVMRYGEKGITTGASQDLNMAAKLARSMVCDYGMLALEDILYGREPWANDPKALEKIGGLLRQAYDKAERILKEKEVYLDALATALLQKNSLTEDDFDEIMNRVTDSDGQGG